MKVKFFILLILISFSTVTTIQAGIIRPYSGNDWEKWWEFDGRILRPYSGNDTEKWWEFDGRILRPYSGNDWEKWWEFDGKILSPYSGNDWEKWWEFDGKILSPYSGNDWEKWWEFDGRIIKPYSGNDWEKWWVTEEDIPIPVIAKIIGIIDNINTSNVTNLSNLRVNGYSLSPSFSANITNYTVAVPNSVTSISISATAAEVLATVSGTGEKSLTVGDNVFNIVVTAKAGSTKTYRVTIKREKQSQTITFPEIATKTYGDDAIALLAKSSSGLSISYKSSNTAVAAISDTDNILIIRGVGTATITAVQNGNTIYAAAQASRTVTVNKAKLTITAEDKIRSEGQPNHSFTFTCSGFKNNETRNVLDALPMIYCKANVDSPAGFYDIILLGGSDNNYQYTLVNGRLEVTASSGIDDVVAKQLKIFPNPVKDDLFIKSELQIKKVEIYSLSGSLMILENNFNEKITVSAIPQGVYLLKVDTDKGLIIRKIVKY